MASAMVKIWHLLALLVVLGVMAQPASASRLSDCVRNNGARAIAACSRLIDGKGIARDDDEVYPQRLR